MGSKDEHSSENNDFLGKGWEFPVRFSNRGENVGMSEQEIDIRESLEILISTTRGERVMRPDYGTNLQGNIFDAMRTSSAARISEDIRRSILFHEPRVVLEEVSYREKREEGLILITVEYTIIATNTRTNLVYPFYINEATDL
ncbi:MAG: GPW/gp25 family protein [Balneolales bacterium]